MPHPLKIHQQPDDDYPPDFVEFWNVYPKRVGKKQALITWLRVVTPRNIYDVQSAAAAFGEAVSSWPRSEYQFLKDPSTWLNAGCWHDDMTIFASRYEQPQPRKVDW